MTTTTAGKRKALAWAVVGLLLLVVAAVSFTRPTPADIPADQLIARSSADAKTLTSALPPKAADKRMALQGVGSIPDVVTQISGEDGVSAVRVWSPSGTLLAASDAGDPTVAAAAESAAIAAAHGPNARPSSLSNAAGDALQTFDPVLPDKANGVVVEIVRSTTEHVLPFKAIGAGLAGIALVFLIVAVTALLTSSGNVAVPAGVNPVSPDGEPLAPEPPRPVRSDPEPAAAAVDPGEERDLQRMRQKLKTSEASRAAMETQMEQLRAQLRVGTQGSDQIVAGLDSSLASSQLRAHEAGEKLLLAETRAKAADQRAAVAEEALSRATPSDATERLGASETEVAAAMARIATLEGELSDHQARARDAEARAKEAQVREAAITEQVQGHTSQTDQAEQRERTLSERATQAEMRASNAEQALANATQRVSELEARLAAAPPAPAPSTADEHDREALTQARMELARAQDLGEQALAKLEISENRAASADAQTAELRKQVVVAESRVQEAELRAAKAAAREPVVREPVVREPI
ncbi:MAG: hypothetical protein QOI81_2072, partial [Actinomycetota bacterium]|nr:hypothetical protein [Actinomycetota bacterium]